MSHNYRPTRDDTQIIDCQNEINCFRLGRGVVRFRSRGETLFRQQKSVDNNFGSCILAGTYLWSFSKFYAPRFIHFLFDCRGDADFFLASWGYAVT